MLKSFLKTNCIEAGCDEAGRGCLAGPVVAAAVILPSDFSHPVINDSKLLSAKIRKELRHVIEESAISWAIGVCTPAEIDDINILNASFLAMHRAVEKLPEAPQHLLIDGNRFRPFPGIPHTCLVKGDSKFYSVAAASILAKTYRDELMQNLHEEFPHYRWDLNKGYPTRVHRAAIAEYGVTNQHRMTFRLLDQQLQLAFK